MNIFTVRNEVAKVMFLQTSVCPRGEYLTMYTDEEQTPPPPGAEPPWTRYTPLGQVHPSRADTPRTRYTPRDQAHPLWDQVQPPGTRYTSPLGPGTPPGADTPRSGTPPGGQVHSPRADNPLWDQVHPPRDQVHTPPRYGHCRGRYASYWNAFLFTMILFLEQKRLFLWSLAILNC